jgi:hypothetical protein
MSKLGTAKASGSISVPGTIIVTVTGMLLVALGITAALVF